MAFFKKDISTQAYSKERVDALRAFCDVLVENAVKKRERVELVERLSTIIKEQWTLHKITNVVQKGHLGFPDFDVDVLLIGALKAERLFKTEHTKVQVETFVPEQDTFCRFTVASGYQLAVTDSILDLVVCNSPYAAAVRSYIGSPIIVRSWVVGTLCVYGPDPHPEWTGHEKEQIAGWAAEISEILELGLIGVHPD